MKIRMCILFTVGVINTLSAEVVFDTFLYPQGYMLMPGGSTITYVSLDFPGSGHYRVQQQFNFDPATPIANHFLDSVSLELEQYDVNGSISVDLYSGSGAGNFLAALHGPSNPGTGVVTYKPDVRVDLSTLGAYYVIITGTGYAWMIKNAPRWDHQSVNDRIDWAAIPTGGSGGYDSLFGGNNLMNNPDGQYYVLSMQVVAFSTIPEPSTFALAGLGAAALVIARQRRWVP